MGKERKTMANQPNMQVRVDGYTRVCLTAIAVLLTVLICGLWAQRSPTPQQAQAAQVFANSSARLDDVVNAQTTTTQKLTELISLMKSGQVKVQVIEAPGAATTRSATHVDPATPEPLP
jgi:hypothetical protein